jgi:biopolymer transport protein ExbD
MAFSTQGDGDAILSDINITPLVDVMLVLLVAFIVTAPLLNNAVKVNLPKTETTAPPQQKKATNVSIDASGQVFIDKQPVPLEKLEIELRARQHADPDLALHLQADEAVAYRNVAKAMAIIERAGITKLSVLTANQ